MSLRYLRREEFYSVYVRPNRRLKYVPHKWTARYDLTSEVIGVVHDRYITSNTVDRSRVDFREFLSTYLNYPEDAFECVSQCSRCAGYLADDEDTIFTVHNRGIVCDPCIHNYWQCNGCEEYFTSTTTTRDGQEQCESCLVRNFTFCDDCDAWVSENDDHYDLHTPEDESSCEAPGQVFSVRDGKGGLLKNDRPLNFTVEGGYISYEGMIAICRVISEYGRRLYATDPVGSIKITNAAYDAAYEVGNEWKTNKGTFPKRLSRHVHNKLEVALPADLLAEVGNIARNNSQDVSVEVEFTRDLNRPAVDFYHDDSCWWGSYSESRCSLKNNGGIGLRSFEDSEVTGRVWVQPLKVEDGKLVPTFESENPDAFVIYNGYGKLDALSGARVIAGLYGWKYNRVELYIDPQYVNGESGYLVSTPDILTQVEARKGNTVTIDTDPHADLWSEERLARKRELVPA